VTHLDKLDIAVAACMKCGFCKAACPVFIGEETNSPRAKVRLARAVARGEMELTAGVKRQMERCLNCRACAVECPSGVEPNRIALSVREVLVERNGMSFLKRLIFRKGLPSPRLMALGSRLMGLGQHLSAIDLQNNPLRLLLPLVGMRKDKDLPVMGRRPLFSLLPEMIEPIGKERTTVLYFPGCAQNLIYPEMGLATVEALRKLRARVLMPHDMVCCSTPVFNSGDVEGARVLARRNLTIMTDAPAEMIVTSCGSCGLTISHEWKEVLGLSEAAPVARKVIDIHDFIARYAPDEAISPLHGDEVVTYHDSCHLRRGMGILDEPRQLLRAALGKRFVEMESADRCCGGGGTFSLYHPDLSQEIAETKMRCLSASGADMVAAGCPACVMQLRDSIVHRTMPQRSVHSIEIINRALRLTE
jgi:glycolate oxidase iron-sulfur subunit